MFHIVLYEPEIPPNTGNIIRLAANIGARLHLIEPLGFSLNDSKLKRAGLDYHELASIITHRDFTTFRKLIRPKNIYACSTKGTLLYTEVAYQKEDALLFGPETRGLPIDLLNSLQVVKIPMQSKSRSLNLSNAVAIIAYEAWRQQDFTL